MVRLVGAMGSGARAIGTYWRVLLPILAVAALLVALVVPLAWVVDAGHIKTGFKHKTIWSWLQLLGVPLTVAVIAGVVTAVALVRGLYGPHRVACAWRAGLSARH